MSKENRYDGPHLAVSNNFNSGTPGVNTEAELERGVYVALRSYQRNQFAYEGISTAEARAAGEALIAVADDIEARYVPKYPEEPAKYAGHAIVRFAERVPAIRLGFGRKWKFITMSREFTWEELCEFVGDGRDFEVLYPKGGHDWN